MSPPFIEQRSHPDPRQLPRLYSMPLGTVEFSVSQSCQWRGLLPPDKMVLPSQDGHVDTRVAGGMSVLSPCRPTECVFCSGYLPLKMSPINPP